MTFTRTRNRPPPERLTQIYWICLFICWVPALTSSGAINGSTLWVLFGTAGPEDMPTITLSTQIWWLSPALGPLTAVALIALICQVLNPNRNALWLALPLILITPLNFLVVDRWTLLLFNDDTASLIAICALELAYCLAFIASVLCFLRRGHMLSPSFSLFLVALIADWALYRFTEWLWTSETESPAQPLSVLGLVFEGHAPALTNTLAFLTVILLIRVVTMAWSHNRSLWKTVNKRLLLTTAWHTLTKLWWPMLAIFVIFSGIYWAISTYVITPRIVCEVQAAMDKPCDPTQELEDAVDQTVEHQMQSISAELRAMIAAGNATAQSETGNTADAIMASIRAATKGRLRGTEQRRCGLNPFCYVMNGVKSKANSEYQRGRNLGLAKLQRDLTRLEAKVTAEGGDFSAQAQALITRHVQAIENNTRTAIRRGFLSHRILSWISLTYSIVILLKTYLIVYARVLFQPRERGAISAQFQPGQHRRGQGEIQVRGHGMSVRKTIAETRYYSYSGVKVQGPRKDRKFPLKLQFLFMRLRQKRVSMLHVPGKRRLPTDHSTQLSVDAPAEIVTWTLKKNERVYFNYSDMIGFGGEVTLGRTVSMALATLILGRIIYYYAEGPGTLLLKTGSKAQTSLTRVGNRPSEPATLVAWSAPVRFLVDAKLDITNTFLSSYNLQKSGTGHIVRDTHEDRANSVTGGVLRFATQFLLPV